MQSMELRDAIRSKYKTDTEFAAHLGWPKQKLSKTILGQRSPKISDVNQMSRALGISVERVISFFEQ